MLGLFSIAPISLLSLLCPPTKAKMTTCISRMCMDVQANLDVQSSYDDKSFTPRVLTQKPFSKSRYHKGAYAEASHCDA